MKPNLIAPIVLLAIVSISLYSCKRTDNCSAGTGGDLTIVAYPKHHGVSVPSHAAYLDTVFVEFNTQDAPPNNNYDTYFVGEEGEDHIHLEGLKCGSYYFFATGYDSTIFKRVKGGLPYKTEETTGEINLTMPVTEVH